MLGVARKPVRRFAALALSLALVATPLPAADDTAPLAACLSNPNSPFLDNRDGFFVNFEEPPIHPLELSADGTRLYATNIPDARVSVFDLTVPSNPVLIRQIGVGLGPVTVRRRPPQEIVLPNEPAGPVAKPAAAPVGPLAAHGAAKEVEVDPDPGPVTLNELWVVCASSNAIFIIDEATLRVTDSVRLPHRPMGLVFDAAGDFAYVTLSDSNRIARLNANNPQAAPVFYEYDSEMPLGTAARADVEEPRSLMLDGDDLYALSFLSGNGTTGDPFSLVDATIADQWSFAPGNPTPSDRDVLHFDVSAGAPQGSAALWRMGTLNFDLAKVGDRIYVTTLDLRNQDAINEGEPQYRINSPVIGSSFALHAVTHAAPSAAGTPQGGTVVIDLNDPANHAASVPAAFKCAVPTDLLITASGRFAYIACNETRNVARLDLGTDRVNAEFEIPAATRAGFGMRGVALSANERWLYAYGRGDNTLAVFDTANLVAGVPRTPTRIVSVGFDITPADVIAGRFHFLDASNSLSGLVTCNTCHLDGHLDGLAWDLSDFTGDIQSDPKDFPRTPKGAKVTMSLLGIEETPPFHWRGDRADLGAFDPAFEGLLGGTRLDDPNDPNDRELEEFLAFVFSLSYPANPNQNLDRSYTANAELGFDCFSMEIAHDVSSDTAGGILQPSCEECHSMAGASGTLNQVNNPIVGLLADDATQLRGIWDKTSDEVNFNLAAPCQPPPADKYCNNQLSVIPATGWGLANTGFVDSLIDFINLPVFAGLPAGAHDRIEDFIQELDTGSAPTTAATHQIDGTLPAAPPYPSPVQELLDGAAAGDNDLIVRGWIRHLGAPRTIGMLYDPAAVGGPVFVTDTVDVRTAGCAVDGDLVVGPGAIGHFTLDDLDTMVANGDANLALIGTSVGSGRRLSIDTDMDCLGNGDEIAASTSPTNPDSDGDGFPDGYEVRLASNPTLPGSTPTDAVDPQVTAAVVSWFNSNVAKVRWSTDEESPSRLRIFEQVSGGPEVLVFEGEEPQLKRYHVMVGRGLEPGRTYRAEVEAEDPSGNLSTPPHDLGLFTTQSHLFDSVHLASTTITHLATNPNGTERYQLDFHVVDEDGNDVQGAEIVGGVLEWNEGLLNKVATVPNPLPVTGANGVATVVMNGQLIFGGLPGVTEALAIDVSFVNTGADTRLYFHSLDGQCGHWSQVGLYGGTAIDPCP